MRMTRIRGSIRRGEEEREVEDQLDKKDDLFHCRYDRFRYSGDGAAGEEEDEELEATKERVADSVA